MHSSLTSFSVPCVHNSLNFGNLSLELHEVPTVSLESNYQGLYLYILTGLLILRKQPWRCTYFDAELTFVARMFL